MRVMLACRFVALIALVSCAEAQTIEALMGVGEGHCSVALGALDGKTFACQVWDHDRGQFDHPAVLEIYRDQRRVTAIKPGEVIAEWHFWNNGEQISVHTANTYRLYDTTTGKQIALAVLAGNASNLPVWAKDRSELEDESVPEGPSYVQQRTLWIAKVLRQIEAIGPGMTRSDLESIMTTEGGISTREQRTYVYKGCPYIKVDAVFAPKGANIEDDVLVSVSRPYLQFSVMD